jgi:hypothetical protein
MMKLRPGKIRPFPNATSTFSCGSRTRLQFYQVSKEALPTMPFFSNQGVTFSDYALKKEKI